MAAKRFTQEDMKAAMVHAVDLALEDPVDDLHVIARYDRNESIQARITNILWYENPVPTNFEWVPPAWALIREGVDVDEGIEIAKRIQRKLASEHQATDASFGSFNIAEAENHAICSSSTPAKVRKVEPAEAELAENQVFDRTSYSRQNSLPDSYIFKEAGILTPSGSGTSNEEDSAEEKSSAKQSDENPNSDSMDETDNASTENNGTDQDKAKRRRNKHPHSKSRNVYILSQMRKVHANMQTLSRNQIKLNKRFAKIERQFERDVMPQEY